MTSESKDQQSEHLPRQPVTIDSQDLLRGERVVHILHAGECYRLLITKNNKLILQK